MNTLRSLIAAALLLSASQIWAQEKLPQEKVTVEARVARLEKKVEELTRNLKAETRTPILISQVVCNRDEGELNRILQNNPGAVVSAPTLGVFQQAGGLICVTVSVPQLSRATEESKQDLQPQ